MAKNKIGPLLSSLRGLERKRAKILVRLLEKAPLVRGALSKIRQRCGKPGCHCVKAPAHVVWRLGSSRDGRQRCQLVRQDDVEWVSEHVERYRDFRANVRSIEAIHKEEKVIMRGLMEHRSIDYE